jgi:hypothetical protein
MVMLHTSRGVSRRSFCLTVGSAAAWAIAGARVAAAQTSPAATATRPDVAAIDHDRILSEARVYLTEQPKPLTGLPCPRSPGTPHDFYSEGLAAPDEAAPTTAPSAPLFTAHADALFRLGLQVPGLAAAGFLTGDPQYARHAAEHLRAWFVDPATSMTPNLDYGQVLAGGTKRTGRYEGILETLPLVEVAQAIPFLAPALTENDLGAIRAWFAAYLHWLTAPQDSGPRLAALARDRKDHHGSSWVLQVTAYSLLTATGGTAPRSEDSSLSDLRHRFKTVTLRAQMVAEGSFPHEVTSPNPYRNSLFNLDLLAATCELLTTRFETMWPYELQDGPGMRATIAFHARYIGDRGKWPYRSDAEHFTDLPKRRVSMLFAAKAFARPEYADLWKSLAPDSDADPLEIRRTIPIHQPLLWVRQPPRVQG